MSIFKVKYKYFKYLVKLKIGKINKNHNSRVEVSDLIELLSLNHDTITNKTNIQK